MRHVPVKLLLLRIIDTENATSRVSKNRELREIESLLKIEEYKLSYDDYIAPMALWAVEDTGKIARELGVLRVVPKGSYIMGLFGGEKKKGKPEYAGLIVKQYSAKNGVVSIKLYNLTKSYNVPTDLMSRYGVDIYKIYYRGLVNPFSCRTYNVLLSKRGDEDLKKFLKTLVELNQNTMLQRDLNYLNALIKELKTSIDMFNEKRYYVIYRCQRMFSACVPTDLENAVSESHVAYLECEEQEQAYYYAGVLNYLAYKVIESGGSFIRDQFARPLLAIIVAGLSWKTVPEDVRERISDLSSQLSRGLTWSGRSDQRRAFKQLAQRSEFVEIVRILDSCVDKERLRNALNLVSSYPNKNRSKTKKV
ncbi:MAG: hypothetical protein QW780_04790 [Sulfolobales archaeon]